MPVAAIAIPCRTTIRTTSRRCAPSAMRTPISWVRCATEYRDHAVDADQRQQQRRRGERAEQDQREAARRDQSASACSRSHTKDRLRLVDPRDRLPDGRREGQGSPFDAHDETERRRQGRRYA